VAVRLRQVVLVADELDTVVGQVCDSLGVDVCYRDPGVAEFGVHNALMAVGDTFIEVISPTRPGTPAGRYLEKRGGDGGYMVLIQVDDFERERERLVSLGVRLVWEGSGPGIRGMHLHPADVGGAIVSLDEADPAGSWGWAGTAWQEHVGDAVAGEVAVVEVQSDDPYLLAQRWSRLLGRPAVTARGGASTILELDHGAIRFVPAGDERGEGISGFDLRASNRSRAGETMVIGGARFHLV
jgi:hypothetical protein